MLPKKKEHPREKAGLHPRNRHRERYDFQQLIKTYPPLGSLVRLNEYRDASIDFFNPEAVKTLNKALLKHFYGIQYWDIPPNYLCPPIPGRADYLHYLADLLASGNPKGKGNQVPKGARIKCLDIGVGANCVYPIIGVKEYGWSFVGADIDPVSIASAQKIIDQNPTLKGQIECRLQPNHQNIFQGIIQPGEQFDLTLCNPPFHASRAAAQAGTTRKVRNLTQGKSTKPVLNFGGQSNELWCEGGEAAFIANMIRQSKDFADSCLWFSTLVSKSEHLKNTYKALEKAQAAEVKTIPMHQGNKSSRLVAWTFLDPAQQNDWRSSRW
ncbi:23S rRNA (adenine(1618)-N(6))-methyltransferase RlmF [Rufibacter glacialis]|uniref:Ribosomal RNA large subunit methyltransferase F n=1 Tax=Rufibacter glacialis TaxID=1259555 RepID=A0A5M8Q6H8_9BACT|nr:23S rRNA (adenine(1618)-N(6))-methyltransferase RlmF [Rufibacter glacialis]KAA6430718.1 23S rRNA (adenine(1618)-N(6))-methyltransferase RlmF [Rufibacter glacialis]GGK86134.1 ribosomal RNA large subunit methyltransferase F [Rufibacter glacialis]